MRLCRDRCPSTYRHLDVWIENNLLFPICGDQRELIDQISNPCVHIFVRIMLIMLQKN